MVTNTILSTTANTYDSSSSAKTLFNISKRTLPLTSLGNLTSLFMLILVFDAVFSNLTYKNT